jgi:hypothetical protein
MEVRFFDAQFMIYDGEIDMILDTGRTSPINYLRIPMKRNVLDANTWLDIAFIHSLRRNNRKRWAGYEVRT